MVRVVRNTYKERKKEMTTNTKTFYKISIELHVSTLQGHHQASFLEDFTRNV